MSLNLLAAPTVATESPQVRVTDLDLALNRFAALTGVFSVWVPESRWPFLDLPPRIIWRGEQCRALAMTALQTHKAVDYQPVRVHIGRRVLYVQSLNSQTVGAILEVGSTAAKSVGRTLRRLLALAAEDPTFGSKGRLPMVDR